MGEMTMVERVARALEPGAFEVFDQGYTCRNAVEERAFLNSERVVKRARRKARAALEAMRPATLEMSYQGQRVLDAGGSAFPADAVWGAMISAALAEEPRPCG